jgi:mannose-binding lectin 1
MNSWFCVCFLIVSISCYYVTAQFTSERLNGYHQRFEYKHSFKKPFLVNAKGQIPFWDHGGDALPTDEQVRICPSIQERSGWVWSKIAFTASNWMFDTSFSISGRNTYGADGMVFWFTADKGSSGNMFGSTSSFTGMALAIDTFDNNGQGDTPRVSVFMGNGSFDYNHGT